MRRTKGLHDIVGFSLTLAEITEQEFAENVKLLTTSFAKLGGSLRLLKEELLATKCCSTSTGS